VLPLYGCFNRSVRAERIRQRLGELDLERIEADCVAP
jgi:hypothetical protein